MRSRAFVGGRSLFKCRLKLLEISLPNARVCIETLGLGAGRNTHTLDLAPSTVSNGDLVLVTAEDHATLSGEDLHAEVLHLFQRHDVSEVFDAGPRREAVRALLLMLDEVVLEELLAGVTLPSDLHGHTGL